MLFQSYFHPEESSKIQDTIQNVNVSFVNLKTIQHVKKKDKLLAVGCACSDALFLIDEKTSEGAEDYN